MAVIMGRGVRILPLRYWAPAFAGEELLLNRCVRVFGAGLDILCSAARAGRW